MKWLYKYPQAAYPYGDLIETNKRRNRGDMEYELLDTGIFNGDRYFDVFVEYAKQAPGTSSSRSACVIEGLSRPRYTFCRLYGFATSGHGGLVHQSLC